MAGKPRRVALLIRRQLMAAASFTLRRRTRLCRVSLQVIHPAIRGGPRFHADLTRHNKMVTRDQLAHRVRVFLGQQQISQPQWNAGTWSQTGSQVFQQPTRRGTAASPPRRRKEWASMATFSGTNTNPTASQRFNGPSRVGGTPPTPIGRHTTR